jgi:hypothetical protein
MTRSLGQVAESADARGSEPRARNGRGSATLPLVTRSRLVVVRMDERPAGSHKPGSQVRLLNPQLGRDVQLSRPDDQVVEAADTRGREPRPLAGVGVQVSPWLLPHGPVVQRRRPLAYTQVTMVRVHPGSLNAGERARRPTGGHQFGRLEVWVQLPAGPFPLWKVAGYGWPGRSGKAVPSRE